MNKSNKIMQDREGNFSFKRLTGAVLLGNILAVSTTVLLCSIFGKELTNQELLKCIFFGCAGALGVDVWGCAAEFLRGNSSNN